MSAFAIKNLMEVDDLFEAPVELRQWDVVRVAPETVRGFDAGPEGMELIVVGADKPEGGDGVLVKDRWAE